ncbi:MAG: T9SS type A sorting domain-containing protein [Saprospiraceae bacterium]|nr:T9SS type A sorting domain-containing protein [Saprospiraceae bacterium]
MTRFYIPFFLFFAFALGLRSQSSLWPGDVNNNGVVNSIDLLYCAYANGSSGFERPDASIFWEEQDLGTAWTQNFPDGINYSFADCNGDGFIDLLDLVILDLHQEDTHGIYQGELPQLVENSLPPIVRMGDDIEINEMDLTEGLEITMPIYLGDVDANLSDIFGIAFLLRIDTTYVGDNFQWNVIQPADAWLAEEAVLNVTEADPVQQIPDHYSLDLAFYIQNLPSISGNGKIAELQLIVIEDDLTLLPADTSIQVFVEPIRVFNLNAQDQLLSLPDTLHINFYQDSLTMLSDLSDEEKERTESASNWRIYPNPASNELHFHGNGPNIEHVTIYSALGQQVIQQHVDENNTPPTCRIQQLPDGLYWVYLHLEDGTLQKKSFIKHDP